MRRKTSPPSLARRVLSDDLVEVGAKVRADRKSWLPSGLASLAVSAVGIGVASTLTLTAGGADAQGLAAVTTRQVTAQDSDAAPAAFDRRSQRTSRSTGRASLTKEQIKSLADQRAENLSKVDETVEAAARIQAAAGRDEDLAQEAKLTQLKAVALKTAADEQATQSAVETALNQTSARTRDGEPSSAVTSQTAPATRERASTGRSRMPVPNYSIAARFGAVGAWSRYHTGIDLSGPIGTPVYAPASGVVTFAGYGGPAGWAGNYVTVRHANGTSSLYAHMSVTRVSVGQQVSAGQQVGAIGMTGRTFGPHLHFEVYPSGVRPGDVYSAVNPEPWLRALGLNI